MKIRNFAGVKVRFSLYENGTVKGELFTKNDILLSQFSKEGDFSDPQQSGRLLFLKDNMATKGILSLLVGEDLISTYTRYEGTYLCVLKQNALSSCREEVCLC